MKMQIRDKKASEMMFLMLLVAVIFGLIFITLMLPLFKSLTSSAQDSVAKGICSGLLALRKAISSIWLVGSVAAEQELFSLGPACGNVYLENCTDANDCRTKIRNEINYCWNMTRGYPDVKMTCLYSLDIGYNAGSTDLCKDAICGTGTHCTGTSVPNEKIKFIDNFCARVGDSISIEYKGGRVEVRCMGGCKP